MAADVKENVEKLKSSQPGISVTLDESTDITDIAQLSIFVRFLDEEVQEFRKELLGIDPLITTTGRTYLLRSLPCLEGVKFHSSTG
ncbi:hypothetical protein HOLleu_41470 [Holothuria leucospilota]|uniref:Uncharacterized protein n=1 Tax=Holothuria leucospilota TaxID=206669 RepID=A0A9Q0YJ70_HOLLE|nr:hypothetical protein HOLleu_41470 [Holothuria leucospilota]